MSFTKSAPVVSRSAFAAKSRSNKFWGSSNQNQNQSGPGFFVSTPQFTRHQNTQSAPYVEDGRGAGNSGAHSDSYGIDNPYSPLTAGGNTAAAAPAVVFDDESKEETPLKSYAPIKREAYTLNQSIVSFDKSQLRPRVAHASDDNSANTLPSDKVDPLAAAIDKVDRRDLVNSILHKMQRLQSVGSHKAVLDTFEDLETLETILPIEAYNMVLKSSACTGDINTLLEGYERMLARGSRPNDSTYDIVINASADVGESLASKRAQSSPLLGCGTNILESVDEIREGLPVEEHLLLASAILEPVIAAHSKPLHNESQHSSDRITLLCIEHNVSIPSSLLDATSQSVVETIKLQPTIADAASQFSSLSPIQQQSVEAQTALLSSYFKFREPAGAIAFFSGCGAPRLLSKTLLTGVAASGYVGKARRWLSEFDAPKNVVSAVLQAIPLSQAKETLPTATEIFFNLINERSNSAPSLQSDGGSNGSDDSRSLTDEGRCSYSRLCVSAEDEQALYMAIRESKYSEITWDAITISEVLSFFINHKQPLLAADLCAWQIPALASAYQQSGVKGFVEEEIISDTVRNLHTTDQLSLDVSLRLLPVVLVCSQARKQILDIIAAAKICAPHEVAALTNSENLPSIVCSLSSILISANLRATQEEMQIATELLPRFVEDALVARSEFTGIEVANVHESLKRCKNSEAHISLWLKRNSDSMESIPISQHESNSRSSEVSLNISRFAKAPNGLSHALDLSNDQSRLKIPVSNEAIKAIIDACVQNNEVQELSNLYISVYKTQASMNGLARAAAALNDISLAMKCHHTLINTLGVFPTIPTYLSLISSPAQSLDCAVESFNEAKNIAKIPLNEEVYNAVAIRYAKGLQKDELASVMVEMHKNRFQLHPSAYSSIIEMSIKLDQGHQALSMLKSAPSTTKSSLSVKIFNSLMSYFVKISDRDAALDVFMELRNSGTLATTQTYRSLMNAYLIQNQTAEPSSGNADRVLSLMRQNGVPITPSCFAILSRARGVLFKDLTGARNFYRGLVKNSRVRPDESLFEALIEAYICNGKRSEIGLVSNEMKRYRVPVDGSLAQMITNFTN